MKRQKTGPTPSEIRITRRKQLSESGHSVKQMAKKLAAASISFVQEKPIPVVGSTYYVDFFVTSIPDGTQENPVRIALEVDGSFHLTPEAQEKDRKREARILESGRVDTIVRIAWKNAIKVTPEEIACILLLATPGHINHIQYRHIRELRKHLKASAE